MLQKDWVRPRHLWIGVRGRTHIREEEAVIPIPQKRRDSLPRHFFRELPCRRNPTPMRRVCLARLFLPFRSLPHSITWEAGRGTERLHALVWARCESNKPKGEL